MNMSVDAVASLEAYSSASNVVLYISFALVGAAGALLTYLLLTWSDKHYGTRSTAPHDQGGPPVASGRGAASASEAAGHAAQGLKPSSASPRDTFVGRKSASSMHRRPAFQHHDSSSTLPPPSLHGAPSLASTTSFSTSFNSGRSSSTTTTSSSSHHIPLPLLTQQHSAPAAGHSSSGHKQLQLAECPSSDDQEEDLVPASDQCLHPQMHEHEHGQAKPGGLSQAGAAGRLFVPAFVGLPQPSPLRAVSAPLAGLAGASGGSSSGSALEVLPSMQSLTDPSGSITAPVSTSPQGTLQPDVTLENFNAGPGSMRAAGQGRHSSNQQPRAREGTAQGAAVSQKSGLIPFAPAPADDSAPAAAGRPPPPPPRLDLASFTASGIQPGGVPPAATAPASAPASFVVAAQPGTTPSIPMAMQAAAVHAALRPAAGAASANSAAAATTLRAAAGASSATTAGATLGPSGRAAVPAMPVPLVRPLGVCLPSPWNPAATGTTAAGISPAGRPASSLYGTSAASAPMSAQALPPNALYRSPLQHVTLSVKVPARFTPAAASNLQSMVARSVWAGESRLTGPDGQPSDPQLTVLHMVSIPGCIQLFINFTQWQPHGEADSSSAGLSVLGTTHSLAAAGTPGDHWLRQGSTAAVGSALLELGQPWAAGQGPALDQATASSSHDDPHHAASGVWWQRGVRVEGPVQWAPPGGVLESVPAPPWLVEAVCSAIEGFMRAHGAAETLGSAPAHAAAQGGSGGASAGAGQQQAGAGGLQPQHHYEGPVLLSVNGTQYTLKPDPADAHAAWVLQESSSAQGPGLQAVPSFSSTPAALPQHIMPAAVGAAPAAPAATPAPVPHTPAGKGAPTLHKVTPSQQLQQPPAQAATAGTPLDRRSNSPNPAAARTFISTVAHGVAAMHERGGAGLFAGQESPASADPAAPAAPEAPSSSSHSQPSALLRLSTTSRASLALPPGMWAWPLYLPTTGVLDCAGTVDATTEARVAVCGSSAALSIVGLHGLHSSSTSSCRVVLANTDGSVVMDKRVPVEDGVARFLAPTSTELACCKIFYLLPPAPVSSSGAAAASPAPAGASTPPAAAAPALADQLLCMLPLLYLPPAATIELCEAARALMLARSRMMFTQQLLQQEQEHLQEPSVVSSSFSSDEEGWTANAGASAGMEGSQEGLLGTLSLDRHVAAAGAGAGASAVGRGAPPAAAAAATPEAAAGAPRALTAAGGSLKAVPGTTALPDSHRHPDQQQLVAPRRGILGSHAEQLRAEHGTSQHEGSFDTTPSSSGMSRLNTSAGPIVRSTAAAAAAGEPVLAARAGESVAAAAAAARVSTAGSTGGVSQGRPLPPGQQQQQPPLRQTGAGGSSSSLRRGSSDTTTPGGRRSTDSAGHSGSSSGYESRTGLEDEPSKLNLRGRLFEGSSDVHALLSSQYLPILADLGLLIELATAADGSASTTTNPSFRGSSSTGEGGGGAVQAHQHAGMAAEVGLQLLVWFSDMECWHCCQLVLQLLLQLGVDLCFNDFTVTASVVASLEAVKQLLHKPKPAGADHSVPAVGHTLVQAPGMMQPLVSVTGAAPASSSDVSRAGIWGHLRSDFPTVPVQTQSPVLRRLVHLPAAEAALGAAGFSAAAAGGGAGGAGGAGIANPSSGSTTAAAAGTSRPLVFTTIQHSHTSSSSSTTASFHSAESELLLSGAWAGVGPAAAASTAQAGGAAAAALMWCCCCSSDVFSLHTTHPRFGDVHGQWQCQNTCARIQ